MKSAPRHLSDTLGPKESIHAKKKNGKQIARITRRVPIIFIAFIRSLFITNVDSVFTQILNLIVTSKYIVIK